MLIRVFVICYAMILMVNPVFSRNESQCSSRFDYEYKVMQKLVELENFQKAQNEIIEKLVKKNSALINEVENIRNESKVLQSEFKERNMELEVANSTIDSFTARLDNLSSSIKGSGSLPFYGFSAYQSSSRRIATGDKVVFSKTRLDQGNVYDNGTGHFTAPVDGVYIFHATLCTNVGGNCIYAAFIAGSEDIGRFTANDEDWSTCGSGSALARLKKGMNVYLKVTLACGGTSFRNDGNHMNGFSGYFVGE